ncbi:conserved hypothetical protein [Vibrio owensii]|uniref:NACHT domain-containing protein n=1 Tax=Vibrio owensii TaxID=696485 RepID=UPI0028947D46|nr:conserved hypothetical protein [Vibrio owensii]
MASERTISREVDGTKIHIKAHEFSKEALGTNIILANGGAGKSSVLWSIAKNLSEHNSLIPIFIPIKDFPSLEEINNFINEYSPGNGLKDIVKFENIVFFFDGLNDISGGVKQDSEIRKILSLLSNSTSIITSRPLSIINNATYWELELLDIKQVNSYLSKSNLNINNASESISEVLCYPLMLILYVSMRGRVSNISKLFQEYFLHITASFSSSIDILKSLSETTINSYQKHELDTYSEFTVNFKSNYKKNTGKEIDRDIRSLGVLSKKNNYISPIHDSYWEWLIGCGALFNWDENKSHIYHDLNLRRYLYISLGSSLLPIPNENELIKLVDLDIILASYFLKETASNVKYTKFRKALEYKIKEKLSSSLTHEILRAVKSVFISCQDRMLPIAIDKLNSLIELHYRLNTMQEVINDDFLWVNRSILLRYLKEKKLPYLIVNHIENIQSERWAKWSEYEYLQGKIELSQASRLYFSSSKELPKWFETDFKSIDRTDLIYLLRSASNLGYNIALAKWIYTNIDDIADFSKSGSLVFSLLDVLYECSDKLLIEKIVTDFYQMSEEKRGYFIYLLKKIPIENILPLKNNLFDSPIKFHEKSDLFSILVNEFSDHELEVWINSKSEKYSDLGWSAIANRKGLGVLDRIINSLPDSFADLHMIPPLRALCLIDNLPSSLEDILMSKLGSPMQPMATQDFIIAMSNIKPHGILRVMSMIRRSPYMLGYYHFRIFMKEYSKWNNINKIEIMGKVDEYDFKFIDCILYLNIKYSNDDLEGWTELAFEHTTDKRVLSSIQEKIASKAYLENQISRFKPKVFCEKIFNTVIDIYGINSAYKIYKEMSDRLPTSFIENLFNLYSRKDQNTFDSFLYDISKHPRSEEIGYYKNIIEISFKANRVTHQNATYFLEILSPLDSNDIISIITNYQSDAPDMINNLIRSLEERIGIQIVDELLILK